jgi:creatinine amidohydrolase/Fe(II)-dependent formamide hydrolase-like protein
MPEPRILRWETLSKRQFDTIDRERAVVVLTCSPLEVHGPHLPLGADVFEGEGLAERALRFLPERHRDRSYLKLPFIYVATDPVPQPGSIAFRPSTLISVIEDVGRSLARQGFRNVVLSNFHGSPRHFLSIETGCDRVAKSTGIRMLCLFSAMLTRLGVEDSELGHVLGHVEGVRTEDFDSDTHAGLIETSQLLALHPEWVDPTYESLPKRSTAIWAAENGIDHAKATGSGPAAIPGMLAQFRNTLKFFGQETYSGSPAASSAELGEKFLDVLAEGGAEVMTELLDGNLPEAQWHSPLWRLRHLFVNPLAERALERLLGTPKNGV